VLTVLIGFGLLEEKINKYQLSGLVFGAIAIYLIQYQTPVRTTTISIAE
jgi:hypothetical protein